MNSPDKFDALFLAVLLGKWICSLSTGSQIAHFAASITLLLSYSADVICYLGLYNCIVFPER
jgi:hypothetical protein